MGMAVDGKRGIVAEPNVIPLIDILLVLLVIFMLMPHAWGLNVEVPSTDLPEVARPSVVVVQVLADGSLRLNQQPLNWEELESRLTDVFKERADRTAFIQGDALVRCRGQGG